jgi:hypothetical protein
VQVVVLSLSVMRRAATSGRSRLDGWTTFRETLQAFTASDGGILGQDVALVSSSVSLPRLRVTFSL